MKMQAMRNVAVAATVWLAVLAGAGCATQRAAEQPQVPQQQVQLQVGQTHIYRGVDQSNPNNGRASLAPGQFNFNPELSTFQAPGQAPVQKPCNYRFTVSGLPNDPPQQGDSGTVDGLVGYTATFDNNPVGHWSIQHPANVAPDQARQAVSQYAQANRGNVVNGTANNCN